LDIYGTTLHRQLSKDWDYGGSGDVSELMGRIIPSFRIVLEMEKEEWKHFRNALSKSNRKKFDEIFDIPRLYTAAFWPQREWSKHLC
jgi:extradiol dioxygenase family protein